MKLVFPLRHILTNFIHPLHLSTALYKACSCWSTTLHDVYERNPHGQISNEQPDHHDQNKDAIDCPMDHICHQRQTYILLCGPHRNNMMLLDASSNTHPVVVHRNTAHVITYTTHPQQLMFFRRLPKHPSFSFQRNTVPPVANDEPYGALDVCSLHIVLSVDSMSSLQFPATSLLSPNLSCCAGNDSSASRNKSWRGCECALCHYYYPLIASQPRTSATHQPIFYHHFHNRHSPHPLAIKLVAN
jgi:hypothetical protein